MLKKFYYSDTFEVDYTFGDVDYFYFYYQV